MKSFSPTVQKQSLSITCDTSECAFELQPYISEFNQTKILPIIEQVLTEMAVPGRQIRLNRLDVDLGAFLWSDLEEDLPDRLYAALREAVERELHALPLSDDRSELVSKFELLEWYLRRGTLPYWSSDVGIDLDGWIAYLRSEDPASLALLIRRIGGDATALERLVLQLSDARLGDLVELLEPQHAALILAYVVDFRVIDREASRSEPSDDDLLWILIFSYLTQQAGSGFNRKMLVVSLVRGFAADRDQGYEEILALLVRGLRQTLAKHGLPSSLPAVLMELAEEGLDENPEVREYEPVMGDDLLSLAELVRRYGGNRAWLESFVGRLNEARLLSLLEILEPNQAAEIVLFIFDVRAIHLENAVLTGDPDRFNRLLWVLTLSWSAHESGSMFNRKAFLHSLLEKLVQIQRLDYGGVLRTLHLGLARASARAPLRSSLASVLNELLEESHLPEAVPEEGDRWRHFAANLRAAMLANPDQRIAIALSALEQMTSSDVQRLLQNILPAIQNTSSPFAEALLDAAAKHSDPRKFYAQVLAAVVGGETLDFDFLLEEAMRYQGLDGDRATWSIEVLQSALEARFATADSAHDNARLLLHLASKDRGAALKLIRNIESDTEIGTPNEVERLLLVLAGSRAAEMALLLSAIGSLPPSERPSMEQVQRAMMGAIDDSPADLFFDRMLTAAFGETIDRRKRQMLLKALPLKASPLRATVKGKPTQARRPNGHETTEAVIQRLVDGDSSEVLSVDREVARQLLSAPPSRVLKLLDSSEAAWKGLIETLEPTLARSLLQAERIFEAAWIMALPGERSERSRALIRAAVWELLQTGALSVSVLTERVLAKFLASNPGNAEAAGRFRTHALTLAENQAAVQLRETLAPKPPVLPAKRPSSPPLKDLVETDDPIYIKNAGLVLCSPFLPHLFSTLKMLERNEKGRSVWRDKRTASTAVHLLQYLVNGQTSAPEPTLVLNKLMCGLHPSTPIHPSLEISKEETQICGELLQAMRSNWSVMSNSSADAIQETFFVREGRLTLNEEQWKLTVQRKTLDVLVDQIPWSFSTIFHDWMTSPLQVSW